MPAILCLGIYVGDKPLSGVYLSGLSLERGTEIRSDFFFSQRQPSAGKMVSLTTKGSADEQQIEIAPVGKRDKISRHCRQRWWIWLIAFALFVLVVVLVV